MKNALKDASSGQAIDNGEVRPRILRSLETVIIVGLSNGGVDAGVRIGFHHFRQGVRPWETVDAGHNRERFDRLLQMNPKGILANVTDPEFAKLLEDTGLPVVDVSGQVADAPFPKVIPDHIAIGKMAADDLIDRGFERLAYISTGSWLFESRRGEGFRDRCLERGIECDVLAAPRKDELIVNGRKTKTTLAEWLVEQPKPLAVFAAFDAFAAEVLSACRARDIAVPEQVAMLSVDDEPSYCEACDPKMSSIRLAGEKIGYEAAKRLDTLMAGLAVEDDVVMIEPLEVHTRQSTDIIALDDPTVARALAYIREHANERINVKDVVSAAHVNRRTLEKRFRELINRTILQQIYFERVQLARQRLIHTDEGNYAVALNCGFRDTENLTQHFREHFGTTPGAFRKQYRMR